MDTELKNAGPRALRIQELREITNDFSEDQMIGRGGYGSVYKGVYKNGEVAVKLLHNTGLDESDQAFNNEIKIMMKLDHQNIVRLVAYSYETEHRQMQFRGELVLAEYITKALCFEYAAKGSLDKYISDEQHGLDWSTRYRIIKGACEGVKYLHQRNILHLDINPTNILLGHNMEPKLHDFYLSKSLDDDEEHYISDRIEGTHGYMPPEYIEYQMVSKKYDIFSLGVAMVKIIGGPEAYYRSAEMSHQEFSDLVYTNWRRRLRSEFTGYTLVSYCEQVRRCTSIALDCIRRDRHKRPDILHIVLGLKETETQKGVDGLQVWTIPFEMLKTITKDFSDPIGKGHFGAVYKGELNGEEVAVKRLDQTSGNILKQIESEEHLKNLEHENIVRLIGFCHETVQCLVPNAKKPGEYILMDATESLLCYEYLPERSLEDKLWNGTQEKSPKLNWQTRYSVIKGVCQGLRYLHYGCQNAPIVHRDLKPGNILLGDDMVPKLGDFGLSRIVPKNQPHLTMAVGSSGYMAPETLRNTKSSEITPKSDIYSLGVLILEIITGEKCPDIEYSGKNYIEKVRGYQNQKLYVASRYPSLEDRFLQQAVSWIGIGLQCAEEVPEDRPTIEEIMHFIETESSNLTVTGDGEVIKISFRELMDITKMFSKQYGESIFGAFYKGARVDGDEMIVIKLKEQKKITPAQFKSEVNRMRFDHNNILQLKGYCEDIHDGEVRERFLCYVISGRIRLDMIIYGDESLTQLNWEARYKIIQGICQALEYIHEEHEDGVHMDIIPSNIWLDDKMVPKLGACGLSRLFAVDPADVVGSRGYMAPEYVELTKLSTKSDIYGLGLLILQIVTGLNCPSSDSGSAASFVATVHNTWMKDFHVASKYPSLDASCLQQVKTCIKVGVQCADFSPDRRLTAGEIIPMLERECTSKPGLCNALCSVISFGKLASLCE